MQCASNPIAGRRLNTNANEGKQIDNGNWVSKKLIYLPVMTVIFQLILIPTPYNDQGKCKYN
jgi:hypothetical protein